MGDLVNVESALQSCLTLGAGHLAQGSILRFDMIGVDVARIPILRGFRMLPMRASYLGRLRPGLLFCAPLFFKATPFVAFLGTGLQTGTRPQALG